MKRKEILKKKEEIHSSGEARKQLQLLETAHNGIKNVRGSSVAELAKRTEYLLSERFEHSKDVSSRLSHANTLFDNLTHLYTEKKPILEDDLEREEFKEETNLFLNEHQVIYKQFTGVWFPKQKEYLTTVEKIHTLPAALEAISTLDATVREKGRTVQSSVASLKEIGKKIKERAYHKKI